jgi:alpha-tubulin suppressor-like RCC1 family protein
VAYLARCARQRRCREAPPIAAGLAHTRFVDAAGRLLACGQGTDMGHGLDYPHSNHSELTLMAAMAGIRVRSATAGFDHSLALSWDGRVYSWGDNLHGQLGHGDTRSKPSPVLVEELDGVRSVASGYKQSLVVTQSGAVLSWGSAFDPRADTGLCFQLRPTIVEGFGEGVRVRRVFAGDSTAFAIGHNGELFSWGDGWGGILGHGDT